MDILIFDDDPYSAELVAALAQEEGYTADKFEDAVQAMDLIRRHQPRLVVTDIMMPGTNGIALCKEIKTTPETKNTHVLVYSGRPYPDDRKKALDAGASAHLTKPVDFEEMRGLFVRLLGARRPAEPAPTAKGPAVMRARVWGNAGSGAEPSSVCVSIEVGASRIILDAGSSLNELASTAPIQSGVWFLLSQTRADRVAGLPALSKWLKPGTVLNIASPDEPAVLAPAFGPLAPESAVRAAKFFRITEGRFKLWPEAMIETLWTRHPEMVLAYRITQGDRTLVYSIDNEIEDPEATQTDFTEKFGRFVRGADLLIHDSRYLDSDYAANRDRGHSSPASVIDLAVKEGVRKALLIGFDPRYPAAQIAAAQEETRARLKAEHWTVTVDFAQPGLTVEI